MIYCSYKLRIYIQQSIKIYPLDCPKLHLNVLFKINLQITNKMIETNIDVLKVKLGCV